MNEISTCVAFWILDAWRRLASQLQTSYSVPDGFAPGDSVRITLTDPPGATLAGVAVGRTIGHNIEWTRSLTGAKFSFDVTSEGIATLTIEFSNGNKMLLAEVRRVAQGELTPKEIAEQMVASGAAGISAEDKAALNQEFAGLSYEEIRARVAESMAKPKSKS